MEAIVLAGGLGTRLRGVVADVPKPLAPVRGRPFLALLLDQLVEAGFVRAILAVGYRHEAIGARFGERYRTLPLIYSVESEPLGTGGAIRLAWEHASAPDVFVVNGDTLVEVDHRAMLAEHIAHDAEVSMAICQVPDIGRYGSVEATEGVVQGFIEKGSAGPGWINGGVYVLNARLLERFPPRRAFSFERDVLAAKVKAIRPRAFRTKGPFIDIGIPDDYQRAQRLVGL